jgi:hypothetical protein
MSLENTTVATQTKPIGRPFLRRTLLGLALPAIALALGSAVGPNTAAACRGAGSTVSQPGGIKYTTWSDGAWLKQYSNGSAEWSYPSGSDPVPGSSPGHNPRPGD